MHFALKVNEKNQVNILENSGKWNGNKEKAMECKSTKQNFARSG
jgi:hypothetical protein